MSIWTMIVCPMLGILVYLRVLKGDQRAVAERGTAFLSTALTYVSTKDVLCCTLPFSFAFLHTCSAS